MNQGDFVRYTAAWLRSGNPPRHEVLKLARAIGRVEAISKLSAMQAVEISWPGTRRHNQLVNADILEVVQERNR